MACKEHKLNFTINVIHFEDKPGNGSIELLGRCEVCGVPLVFYGPRGSNAPFPLASPDRTELRIPVTFGYGPKFLPGPTILLNGPELEAPPVN
jgi:hypothetical protein